MTSDIRSRYFSWLCDFVYDPTYTEQLSYNNLLHRLFEVDFYAIIPIDENRYKDGIDLRYRFGEENDISNVQIATELDVCFCSVFEMMVALALRCELVMMDGNEGDRTGQWFWNMVLSLGLNHMDDDHYFQSIVDNCLAVFLNRMYQPNGNGGLFTIEDCPFDMSEVEIWQQACWFLDGYISKLEV